MRHFFAILLTALALPATVASADDLVLRRNEHQRAALRAWYSQDRAGGAWEALERDRLDLLLVTGNAASRGMNWVRANSLTIRQALWQEKRRAEGGFVPEHDAVVQLELILEATGLSALGSHTLLEYPFRYSRTQGDTLVAGGAR